MGPCGGPDFGLGSGFCCCPLVFSAGDLICWFWFWFLFSWLGWGEVMFGLGGGDWILGWVAGVAGVAGVTGVCGSSGFCCCCCCIGPFMVSAGPGAGGGMMGSPWFCGFCGVV